MAVTTPVAGEEEPMRLGDEAAEPDSRGTASAAAVATACADGQGSSADAEPPDKLCAICLCACDADAPWGSAKCCQAHFHYACLMRWLDSKEFANSCPACRCRPNSTSRRRLLHEGGL